MSSRQHKNGIRRRRFAERHAVVLVCVLACLAVASTITLASLSAAMRHRRQLRSHWQLEQTVWLLDAGYRRAIEKRQQDPSYSGESWQLDEVFDRPVEAQVLIAWAHGGSDQVSSKQQDSSTLRVVATVQGPDGVTRRSQRWNVLPDSQTKAGE